MIDYDVLIIDPASTEFNRGSFCYLPYILYSALKSDGVDVGIVENFTAAELDSLPKANHYLVALWSYPQLDICFILNQFLKGKRGFFGFYPLVEYYKLPVYRVTDYLVLRGIEAYPAHYSHFKYILLSDCDMHLKKYSGQVYPLFTSYGCPRKCSFCPSSVNCGHQRLSTPVEKVKEVLNACQSLGVKNIHFTDEDFFYDTDRAGRILEHASSKNMKFIALGSVDSVRRFIKTFGNTALIDSGAKLIEVGMETADPFLTKEMGKPSFSQCEALADEISGADIFWLTLTFFPGETISTLNETGRFLDKNGHDIGTLYGRIATNSTRGGLGQFFQPYHGTKGFDELGSEGIFVSDRPIRLIPSFLPHSFIEDVVEKKREVVEEDYKWFDLYNLPDSIQFGDGKVFDILKSIRSQYGITLAQAAMYLAICARLEVI